ncbi:MAG TPA: hypothetical protein DCE42_05855 [Myxococcales bacterium]|nr:hypothetical protein [Myxococcales bacterium]
MAFREKFWAGLTLCGLLLLSGWLVAGCSNPDACNNDNDCTDGKICYQKVCSDKSVLPKDGGSEEKESPDKKVEPEPSGPEAEPKKEAEPKPEPTPEKPTVVGLRKKDEPCDPRPRGYEHDLCGPGLACAETGSTNPSSGSPQPFGICVEACDPNAPKCPAGTVCRETHETKAGQRTGIWGCMQEQDAGGSCLGNKRCKDGLTCVLYDATGANWYCQKDCTNDSSVCGTGESCLVAVPGTSQKVCKKEAKLGENCGVHITCESDSVCIAGNRTGTVPSRCLKKCSFDFDCGSDEVCRNSVVGEGRGCFKKADRFEECNRYRACESTSAICLGINDTYSACYERCTSAAQCGPNHTCGTFSSQSSIKVCRQELPPGSTGGVLLSCQLGGRSIALDASSPNVCLYSCSNGTATNAAFCGNIGAGNLYGVARSDTQFWTVGANGMIAVSTDGGDKWTRVNVPTLNLFYNIGVSADGKSLVAVGVGGMIWASTDGGDSWKKGVVTPTTSENLFGVVLSDDGKTAVAVGNNGVIIRSEDGGLNWTPVTLTPALKTTVLKIAKGRYKGTGAATTVLLAVGVGGLILRSEDFGKTWTDTRDANTTAVLRGVDIVTDKAATGVTAIVVGDGGTILTSTDDGKSWTKATSGVTTTLSGASVNTDTPVVSGSGGVLLYYDSANTKWEKATSPGSLDTYNLIGDGTKAVAVGRRGIAYFTADAGKTWKTTTTSLSVCLPLTSSTGAANGGACLYLCDPANNGKDCPGELTQCSPITVNGKNYHHCAPGGELLGQAKRGEECVNYSAAPAKLRCVTGNVCAQLAEGGRCMTTCDPNAPKCPTGETCNWSVTFRAHLCGKTVTEGKECDPANATYCADGLICEHDDYTAKKVCKPIPVAKELESCLDDSKPCGPGTTCIGLASGPYRRFCARSCTPGASGQCDSGWQCLSVGSGRGICAEKCTASNYQCKVAATRCQQLQVGSFCF